MKLFIHYVGLFIVGLVVLPSIKADISLTLKNKQYLTASATSAQESFTNNNQQKFEESKYGNSRYQVFEVHNRFEPSQGQSVTAGAASDNNHAPAPTAKEIRIEHINAPAHFPLDNPEFDESLLKAASKDLVDNQKNAPNHGNAPASSASNNNIPVPFPSNYRHDFSKKTSENLVEYDDNSADDAFQGSQYLPPTNNGGAQVQSQHYTQGVKSNNFRGPGYLPPPSPYNGQTQFKGSNYLPPHDSTQRVVEKHSIGSDYLPPPPAPAGHNNAETSFKHSALADRNNAQTQILATDNLPSHGNREVQSKPFKGNQYGSAPSTNIINNNPFKGPGYLLPSGSDSVTAQKHQEEVNSNNVFEGPPPQSGSNQQSSPIFKGPGYLPPNQSGSNIQSDPIFKGPEYLSPFRSDSKPQDFPTQKAFKTQDYRPPHINDVVPQESTEIKNSHNGQVYLPPQHSQSHQHQQQTPQQYHVNNDASQSPAPLPPGYDFVKPPDADEAIAKLHTLPDQQEDPENSNNQQTQLTVQVAGEEQSSDIVYGRPKQDDGPEAPTSLPQDYDFKTPENAASLESLNYQQRPSSSSSRYQAPSYLTPTSDFQREGRTFNTHVQIPQGYDFSKPSGSEEVQVSHAQSHAYHSQTQNFGQQNVHSPHKGSGHLPPAGSAPNANKVFHGHGYLPPTGPSPQTTAVFKGPGYLPPIASAAQPDVKQDGHIFQGLGYLPPSAGTQTGNGHIFQGPGYLPPPVVVRTFSSPALNRPDYFAPLTVSSAGVQQSASMAPPLVAAPKVTLPTQTTAMYPLNSFMTGVQPYDRYGRKPFPEYGPPPAPTSTSNEVAPMYKEPASRPQHYAPAMSYSQNGLSSESHQSQTAQNNVAATALSQQTRQALRTLMPQDIRQDITPPRSVASNAVSNSASTNAVHASAVAVEESTATRASGKIRTVQIVNNNTVKTLKVLESMDHTGVKTIHILGISNEEPVGDHRVVKVVTGQENTVQTVKIYNDQTEAPADAGAVLSSNDYLPPRHKRNPAKAVARDRQIVAKH